MRVTFCGDCIVRGDLAGIYAYHFIKPNVTRRAREIAISTRRPATERIIFPVHSAVE